MKDGILDTLRVDPGTAAGLADRPTDSKLGLDGKADAAARLDAHIESLRLLQNHLWAEDRRSLLLVLQAMDAGGKDGTIRKVFTGLNPQGCRVTSFREPSPTELDHDYLWRVHASLPRRGEIGIFNRSHYEDVVTVPILGLADDEQVERRLRQIRDFERMLTEEGTTLVKVFLHISKDEQRERLQARLDDPEKRWKFKLSDLETRARWDDYQDRYEAAITATSTEWAPWWVVPADRKWVRDVAVAVLLCATLSAMDPQIPAPEPGLDGVRVD